MSLQYFKFCSDFLKKRGYLMPTIDQINALHMTSKKVYVYAFGFDVFDKISEEDLLKRFNEKRKLTVANKDFLDNKGNLLKNDEKSVYMTGCESSKKILETHLRIKPKLICLSIWFSK